MGVVTVARDTFEAAVKLSGRLAETLGFQSRRAGGRPCAARRTPREDVEEARGESGMSCGEEAHLRGKESTHWRTGTAG